MPEPTPSKDSQKAIKYAQEAVENWKDLSPDDFETHVLSGGITNSLICVSKNSEKVIVRLYGKDSEAVVDRERESTVNAAVADCGFNKPTLLEFDGGRVEGWVEGSVINAEDMIQPEMQKRIARRLAELHELDVDISRKPVLFDNLNHWLDMAKNTIFSEKSDHDRLESFWLDDLSSEIESLREKVESLNASVVFCHNDLLSGNIIDCGSSLQFIDFEYAAYNYSAFDVANHFCEMCGFECDWSLFPGEKAQFRFFRSYLAQRNGVAESEVSQDDLVSLQTAVKIFVRCDHLFWGLWAIVQAKRSHVDFGFLDYAAKRINSGFWTEMKCPDGA
eukprot:181324_1